MTVAAVNDPYAIPYRSLTIDEELANSRHEFKQWGASLNATYDITSKLQLGSITGYGKLKQLNLGNDTFITPAIFAARGGMVEQVRGRVAGDRRPLRAPVGSPDRGDG